MSTEETNEIQNALTLLSAKLSERKTVHEWLNQVKIPSVEFDKPICLLRRLSIAIDRLYKIKDLSDEELDQILLYKKNRIEVERRKF